jgi:hypothetical protein
MLCEDVRESDVAGQTAFTNRRKMFAPMVHRTDVPNRYSTTYRQIVHIEPLPSARLCAMLIARAQVRAFFAIPWLISAGGVTMVSTANCQVVAPTQVWSAAPTLSPRVQRLRDQFWSFYEREYTNEVRSYTTPDTLLPG